VKSAWIHTLKKFDLSHRDKILVSRPSTPFDLHLNVMVRWCMYVNAFLPPYLNSYHLSFLFSLFFFHKRWLLFALYANTFLKTLLLCILQCVNITLSMRLINAEGFLLLSFSDSIFGLFYTLRLLWHFLKHFCITSTPAIFSFNFYHVY
jgi:hypothetical protein